MVYGTGPYPPMERLRGAGPGKTSSGPTPLRVPLLVRDGNFHGNGCNPDKAAERRRTCNHPYRGSNNHRRLAVTHFNPKVVALLDFVMSGPIARSWSTTFNGGWKTNRWAGRDTVKNPQTLTANPSRRSAACLPIMIIIGPQSTTCSTGIGQSHKVRPSRRL